MDPVESVPARDRNRNGAAAVRRCPQRERCGELSPVRKHRWVSGCALDRVWQGPAPRDLERDIATMDASVVDPYGA